MANKISTKTSFKKGHNPWNKGKKGIHFSSKSEFKRNDCVGNKNPNWKGGKVKIICKCGCGKEKYVRICDIKNGRGIFYSKKCQGKWNSQNKIGENSNGWKGGKTKQGQIIKSSLAYKLWRKSIFERDNYTCQICRKVGTYLEAHHIKSFAHYPELRLDINNGVTLCLECHNLYRRK